MPGREFEWMRENYKSLQEKYPGKVIAVYKNQIMGVGNTLKEAEIEARKKTTGELFFGRIRKKSAMIL